MPQSRCMGSYLAILAIGTLPPLLYGAYYMRKRYQEQVDAGRKVYKLAFDPSQGDEPIQVVLNTIGPMLSRKDSTHAVPTVVFEIRATDRGIAYYLRIADSQASFMVGQLRTHVHGIKIQLADNDLKDVDFTYGVEVGLTDTTRTLRIAKTSDLSASILSTVQALNPGEEVVHQWVIGHSARSKVPPGEGHTPSSKFSITRAVLGKTQASRDEVIDRRTKLAERTFSAVGRIGAVADSETRAREMVRNGFHALSGANSNDTRFWTKEVSDISSRINHATTPRWITAQLTVSELSAIIGWPIKSPFVSGLTSGGIPPLPATEIIARDGRNYGESNFPGNERPVAVSVKASCRHCLVLGASGVGKTTLLAWLAQQDMHAGRGVIVIEAKGDLFYEVLKRVPRHRLRDVIILDVNDSSMPVGYNILDQGNPRAMVDLITSIFQALYPDTRGVWVRELLFYGLYTLAERKGLSFTDLPELITPRDDRETKWASELKASVKDPELKKFWSRWDKMKETERTRASEALHNRVWQFIGRPELRYILGQSESSFQMADVIRGNKILLVNLAGVPSGAANTAGTLLVNGIWEAVKDKRNLPEIPNFLYMDEFQSFTQGLPMGLDDMLAKARSFNLAMTMANQHYEQLPKDIKSAVRANAWTKIIMQPSPEDAPMVARDMGNEYVTDRGLLSLDIGEAVARFATDKGSSAPVTISTRTTKASDYTGLYHEVVNASRTTYGRPIKEIEASMEARRVQTRPISSRPEQPNWSKKGDGHDLLA